MTEEIAKRIVKGITDKIECNTADIDDWAEFWGFTREEYEEFLDMPIKALEQESKSEWEQDHTILKAYSDGVNEVLDKLRAEIETKYGQCDICEYDAISGWEQVSDIADILQIIDKYKAESEQTDGNDD